jgi:hypothetical protein
MRLAPEQRTTRLTACIVCYDRFSTAGVPIQQRRLSEIPRHVLRVGCRRCGRVVEIQTADAVRLYGRHPRGAVGRDAAKGDALIRQADRLLCESWNERMWADGEPTSPTIDQALNGG